MTLGDTNETARKSQLGDTNESPTDGGAAAGAGLPCSLVIVFELCGLQINSKGGGLGFLGAATCWDRPSTRTR